MLKFLKREIVTLKISDNKIEIISIGDLEKYWIEIFGMVEIKYFFKGSKYPLENIEKSQGEIDFKIFEKGDSNFKNK